MMCPFQKTPGSKLYMNYKQVDTEKAMEAVRKGISKKIQRKKDMQKLIYNDKPFNWLEICH